MITKLNGALHLAFIISPEHHRWKDLELDVNNTRDVPASIVFNTPFSVLHILSPPERENLEHLKLPQFIWGACFIKLQIWTLRSLWPFGLCCQILKFILCIFHILHRAKRHWDYSSCMVHLVMIHHAFWWLTCVLVKNISCQSYEKFSNRLSLNSTDDWVIIN